MDLESRIHLVQKTKKPKSEDANLRRGVTDTEFYDWIERFLENEREQKSENEQKEEEREEGGRAMKDTRCEDMVMIELDATEEMVLQYDQYPEKVWRLKLMKLLVIHLSGRTVPYLFDFLTCLLPSMRSIRSLVYLGLVLTEGSQQVYGPDTVDCITLHLSEDVSAAYRWLASTTSIFESKILERFLNECHRHLSLNSPNGQCTSVPRMRHLASLAVLNLYRSHSLRDTNPFGAVVSR